MRCGLEMAILDALAQSLGCSIFELLVGTRKPAENESRETTKVSEGVRICGLLDGEGTVEDIATTAYQYVLEGYCTLKVKVTLFLFSFTYCPFLVFLALLCSSVYFPWLIILLQSRLDVDGPPESNRCLSLNCCIRRLEDGKIL